MENQMELPTINQRIKKLIKERSMENISRFAREIGVFPQVLSRLFKPDPRSGKYPEPSMGIVTAIINKFEDIDKDWLLFGKGEATADVKKSDVPAQVSVSADILIELEIEKRMSAHKDKRIEELESQLIEAKVLAKQAQTEGGLSGQKATKGTDPPPLEQKMVNE